MPRPHFPPRGGPYLPAWDTNAARKRHHAALSAPVPLRPPFKQASATPMPPLPSAPNASRNDKHNRAIAASAGDVNAAYQVPISGKSQNLLWIAVLVCACALLFTLVVLTRH